MIERLLLKSEGSYRPLGIALPNKWMVFVASTALIASMVASGVHVRRHPIRKNQFVARTTTISESQFHELIGRSDFLYIASISILVTPTGSNQTYTSDATWNNSNNKIEVIGGGAGGGGNGDNDGAGTGGGGGAGYSRVGTADGSSFTFATPGTTTATYRIAATAAGGIVGVGNGQDGTAGNQSWFNGTTLAGSTVGANGGLAVGNGGFNNNPVGGAGASTTGAKGTVTRAGGAGEGFIGVNSSGGGGGAGGPSGAGGAAGLTTGGTADGGVVAGGAIGSPGNSGTEFDSTHGCGSGAGKNLTGVGQNGGDYGGGASGGANFSGVGGIGAQGIIAATWTPALFVPSPTLAQMAPILAQ